MNRREFIGGLSCGAVAAIGTGCESAAYGDRVFDCHLRNVSDPKNGSSGAPAHAGKIDYLPVFRALKAIGYSRWCGLELANAFLEPSEMNPGANPYWIPQSLGYFRALAELA